MSDKEGGRAQGRRARKVQESRAVMANAAVDLVLDRGLDQVTVEAISERADVSRRTFSRYFSGKEDAVVDTLRADYARINTALAARPPQETPLTAYYRALRGWLDDEPTAWHRRLPRSRDLLRLLHEEPALLPAYLRVQDEAQNESVAIVARRLGLDAERDLRPALAVSLAVGAFGTAVRFWTAPGEPAPLPQLIDAAFAALADEPAPSAPGTATK
ncbi:MULTISPECIES: acyl-CoA-like ligand-binding transcription factor [Streptomyces]|uniref:acyl-CoA-like ligand-binding transcription factor n=1 Tax=Streptomyces TaxID=1883 RepID=UPI001E4004D2|nr:MULTISPECIES: TetR family transcriptional regulator [Streptomyces]UFQ19670.1 TetR family transcriptional regulator [Streptomyces huasconensis]WCL89289.1 TetR family transcriptional regulator [Streptomyces sp. JCM 35825]